MNTSFAPAWKIVRLTDKNPQAPDQQETKKDEVDPKICT